MLTILTCEHATNFVPKALRGLFSSDILSSHRAWDRGAKEYGEALQKVLHCPLFLGAVSRLVVDVNRSSTHPRIRSVPKAVFERYWKPFRESIFHLIQSNTQVVHFSCHTFTPVLDGVERTCDIGLLYDPARKTEVLLAHAIQRALQQQTSLRVRCNYPYKGTSDGHTSSLRRHFSEEKYRGIEIEVNQALIGTPYWKEVGMQALVRAIQEVVDERKNRV